MPKSSVEDKIVRYKRKLHNLEEKVKKKRRRIVYSLDSEEKSDAEPELVDDPPIVDHNVTIDEMMPAASDECAADIPPEQATLEELDPEILLALGETTEDSPKFGDKIHENLARLWTPILRKGLSKEAKDKLMKQFLVPENCPMLQAPKLNPEIAAAISEPTRSKDKRVHAVQEQLGLGITAINRALVLLIDSDSNKLEAIKHLSDSCRILCDLHYIETEARKKFVTPGLDKNFLSIVQDVDRDTMLFGCTLSDKIKASKAIEKQSIQIKKPAHTTKPATTFIPQPSTNRPRFQGNWLGPPRYSSNRGGGRGGVKKTTSHLPINRRAPQTNQTRQPNKTHRASQHQ